MLMFLLGVVSALALVAAGWFARSLTGPRPAAPTPQAPTAPTRPSVAPVTRASLPPAADPSTRADAEADEEITLMASRKALLAKVAQMQAEEALSAAAAATASEPSDATVPALTAVDGEHTEELAQLVEPENDASSADDAPLRCLSAIGRTDMGRARSLNEDSFLAHDPWMLYAVADGMGGHAAGEVASRLAIETLTEAYGEAEEPRDGGSLRQGTSLVQAVQKANGRIFDEARANETQTGMGTTLIATHFSPDRRRVYIANVGDSRCYRIRNGALTQLTQDHTLGALYGVKGRGSGKLTRAVGVDPSVEVDLRIDAPKSGDVYLLCSDGLTRMVPDPMILEIIAGEQDLAMACQELIAMANQRGGRDNITVILVRVESVEAQAAAANG